MADYAPVGRRGFFAALPFIGIQGGTLVAAGVFIYLGMLPTEVLVSGVWRIPFLASVLLIAIALFIRLRIRESPAFIVLEKQEQISRSPLREVFSRSLPNVLRGIGLRMAENGGSYLFNTLAVSFVVTTVG
jgi:MHS family metabolite:H+ symporter-like MFS transporter